MMCSLYNFQGKMDSSPHLSVLLRETLTAFQGMKLKCFIDGTVGAGGHLEAISKEHQECLTFIGFDQDETALNLTEQRLRSSLQNKLLLIRANFSSMKSELLKKGIESVSGILVDIGVSSMQLDTPERGFSFMRCGPLDMRMDQSGPLTAADIVNTWDEKHLAEIFFRYGEESQGRKAAKAIVARRKSRPFTTTEELRDLMKETLFSRRFDLHPATKVFQALRIAVNDELSHLEKFLEDAFDLLEPSGRLAVISFHSLEDRIVKTAFNYMASDKVSTSGIGGMFLSKEPKGHVVTKKPIVPTEFEIQENPRSRSAKLRVFEKG